MADTIDQISPGDSFTVKESSFINYLFAIIFLAISIGGFVTMSNAENQSIESYRYIFFISLVPALSFWSTGNKNATIFEINAAGIFYKGSLITTWTNFVNAYLLSEEVPGSLSEHFLLLVEYYNPAQHMRYQIKLKISSSQDKSEDQILAAVNEFYQKHRDYNVS